MSILSRPEIIACINYRENVQLVHASNVALGHASCTSAEIHIDPLSDSR